MTPQPRPRPHPTQVQPEGGLSFKPLCEADARADADGYRGPPIPAAMHVRYGGELAVPLFRRRPTVLANFVSSVDGVVALDRAGGAGGGEVSGFFEPDRFMMSLLRALADVVLVGAGTVRAAPNHRWVAAHAHPDSAAETAAWRAALELPPTPTTVVVTASGRLDPRHPGLSDPDIPVVVATTAAGERHARSLRLGRQVRIEVVGDGDRVMPLPLLGLLADLGARVVLCEGGPHLAADLIAVGRLDELFLTVAPQVLGRSDRFQRLGLVEGAGFPIEGAPWASLLSVRRAGSHLFLRYGFEQAEQE
jgi:riboflavin biosynthesis pyrimidine reductase